MKRETKRGPQRHVSRADRRARHVAPSEWSGADTQGRGIRCDAALTGARLDWLEGDTRQLLVGARWGVVRCDAARIRNARHWLGVPRGGSWFAGAGDSGNKTLTGDKISVRYPFESVLVGLASS